MMAAKNGNSKMIQILLQNGADINAKTQVIPVERCDSVPVRLTDTIGKGVIDTSKDRGLFCKC